MKVAEPFGVAVLLVCSSPSFLELVSAGLATAGIEVAIVLGLVVAAARNRERIRKWLQG